MENRFVTGTVLTVDGGFILTGTSLRPAGPTLIGHGSGGCTAR
jgi:hypothetical protein